MDPHFGGKKSAQAPTTTMTSCSGNQQPNLLECKAADLALYLLEHRFSVNFICFDLQHAMFPPFRLD